MNAIAAMPAGTSLHGPERQAIDAAIVALEAAPWASPALDMQIHRALGWEAQHVRPPGGGFRMRSPLQRDWQVMRRPSANQADAALLVPHGWSFGCGLHNRQAFAWTAQAWPLRQGVAFFECSGMTVALALTRAALFAHRWCAMRAEQLALTEG